MPPQAAAAVRSSQDQLNGRAQTALRLRAEHRLAEALEVLSAPGDYAQDVYTLRGDLQRELGQFHEAVGSYSTVIALDPQNLYAHRNLAGCLRKLGRWSAAAEAFRKILEGDSYSDAARLGLGECLLQLKKWEEGLACFEACWSEAALLPALFGKAVALQSLRRFEASEALYLRFLELHSEPEEALGNLIALSMEMFDLTRVERYANQLLKRRPQSIAALQALMVVAFERRSYESAAEYYGRLLEIVPEEKLMSCGNDDAFEYRLTRKSRELLNMAQENRARQDQFLRARRAGH
jgi:tetratricopeptide (TPR) repeat protein